MSQGQENIMYMMSRLYKKRPLLKLDLKVKVGSRKRVIIFHSVVDN